MSGIDEQQQVFKCPVCEGLEYWIIKTSGIGDGDSVCIGFLNNLKAPRQIVEQPPLFQGVGIYSDMTLQRLLALTDRVLCSNCRHSLVLDGPMWGLISMEIKKGWEGRGYV